MCTRVDPYFYLTMRWLLFFFFNVFTVFLLKYVLYTKTFYLNDSFVAKFIIDIILVTWISHTVNWQEWDFCYAIFSSVNLAYFRINLFIYRTYKVSLCFYLPSAVLSFLPTFLSLLQWRLHSLYIDLLQGNTFSQKTWTESWYQKPNLITLFL